MTTAKSTLELASDTRHEADMAFDRIGVAGMLKVHARAILDAEIRALGWARDCLIVHAHGHQEDVSVRTYNDILSEITRLLAEREKLK